MASHPRPITDPELAEIRTLERLLAWLQEHGLPLAELDLIAQDEYSHDLIIPAGTGEWYSFAVT